MKNNRLLVSFLDSGTCETRYSHYFNSLVKQTKTSCVYENNKITKHASTETNNNVRFPKTKRGNIRFRPIFVCVCISPLKFCERDICCIVVGEKSKL